MSLFGPLSTLLLTLVSFVFIMTVVVFFHELGHFLVGRWCGVKVDAFSIGFGPEIYGRVDSHGTRWRVAAVPLGGYVKFHGDMNAASAGTADEVAAMPEAAPALTSAGPSGASPGGSPPRDAPRRIRGSAASWPTARPPGRASSPAMSSGPSTASRSRASRPCTT